MCVIDMLCSVLPRDVQEYILAEKDKIREVRLRIGKPVQVISERDRLIGNGITREIIKKVIMCATDFSLYSRESEIKKGYFTLSDGSRVGVCGNFAADDGREVHISNIGSISVRVAREIPGCAEALMRVIRDKSGRINPTLLYSLPGMGKTTCLRDISRSLSDGGYCVGIADERHEIAACVQGVPTLEVGVRTDVCDGGRKSDMLNRLIRTMAPDVIITDEIGSAEDAQAIEDAVRCGIGVVASAHAGSFEELLSRERIKRLVGSGVLRTAVQLGGTPGKITDIRMAFPVEEGGVRWESV